MVSGMAMLTLMDNQLQNITIKQTDKMLPSNVPEKKRIKALTDIRPRKVKIE